MGWKQEFGAKYKVPPAFLDLVRRGLFEDRSWRNDTGPSFWRDLPDGTSVVLWVDHPAEENRRGPGTRYFVQAVDPKGGVGWPKDLLATDDAAAAVGAALEAAGLEPAGGAAMGAARPGRALPGAVESLEDAVDFFAYLYEVDRLSFHPDDRFYREETRKVGYVDREGRPSYTVAEARLRDRLMAEAWDATGREGVDIYALAMWVAWQLGHWDQPEGLPEELEGRAQDAIKKWLTSGAGTGG